MRTNQQGEPVKKINLQIEFLDKIDEINRCPVVQIPPAEIAVAAVREADNVVQVPVNAEVQGRRPRGTGQEEPAVGDPGNPVHMLYITMRSSRTNTTGRLKIFFSPTCTGVGQVSRRDTAASPRI